MSRLLPLFGAVVLLVLLSVLAASSRADGPVNVAIAQTDSDTAPITHLWWRD